MICKKCGAQVPDNAKFCGRCGQVMQAAGTTSAALIRAHREVRRWRITTIILAVLCLFLGIGWMVSGNDPDRGIENYEDEAEQIERAGIELSGTYVVGEDEELPAGRYNIFPQEGESYMSVGIYETKEKAKQKYDEDYNSLALEQLYRVTRGYKLKEGQIVVIDSGSAWFEHVAEESGGEAPEESTDEGGDPDDAEASGADAPDRAEEGEAE